MVGSMACRDHISSLRGEFRDSCLLEDKIILTKILKVLKEPKKIKKLPHFLKNEFITTKQNKLFASIAEEVASIANTQEPQVRVLYGLSFSIWVPCSVHDFLLTQALRLRGAEVIPCVMGRLQFGETSYIGGIWGGATDKPQLNTEQSKRNYKRLAKADKLLWVTRSKLNPIPLDRYVSTIRIAELKYQAQKYPLENYVNWTYQDLPVGKWARDALRNNSLVSDERLIPYYKSRLQSYLHHVMVMVEACQGVLDEVKPDIVISNDSYYYPGSILEKLCAQRRISHYNYWPGVHKNRFCYAKGEPAMSLNLSQTWQKFQKDDMTDQQQADIEEYLANRYTGKSLPGINTSDPCKNAQELEPMDLSQLNTEKATALLPANVCWDLSALDKYVQFENMFDWIAKTVRFFAEHPEWQLIVKAHPTEENQLIPETRQKLKDELARLGVAIPENVFTLGPRTEVSVYDLFTFTHVGLVYTTTVGLEMACLGIPVITAGRSHYRGMGFTFDPPDKETYFEQLTQLLSANGKFAQKEAWSKQAKKFFYLYEFEYPIDLGILEYAQGQASTKVKSAKDLMPGKHRGLDFVCDKILNKENIF